MPIGLKVVSRIDLPLEHMHLLERPAGAARALVPRAPESLHSAEIQAGCTHTGHRYSYESTIISSNMSISEACRRAEPGKKGMWRWGWDGGRDGKRGCYKRDGHGAPKMAISELKLPMLKHSLATLIRYWITCTRTFLRVCCTRRHSARTRMSRSF